MKKNWLIVPITKDDMPEVCDQSENMVSRENNHYHVALPSSVRAAMAASR